MIEDELLAAARFERDVRADRYPHKILSGADAEALSIDYQCWAGIAEWLETDRFSFFHGGADPARADAPFIRWPELQEAAARALASIAAKIAALEAAPEQRPESLGELRKRRSRLFAIHHQVQLRRRSIDIINQELRAPKLEQAA